VGYKVCGILGICEWDEHQRCEICATIGMFGCRLPLGEGSGQGGVSLWRFFNVRFKMGHFLLKDFYIQQNGWHCRVPFPKYASIQKYV